MLSISTVESETGLTKDVLRKWETRFGFPMPSRNQNGERYYTRADVDRLLAIKRLIDNNFRPSRVVPMSLAELDALADSQCLQPTPTWHGKVLEEVRKALLLPSETALKSVLYRSLMENGLKTFVLAIVPALNEMVGDGWVGGKLTIHQEHLYSEAIRGLLLDAIGRLDPIPGRPKVLLTTPPEERHDLGLMMAHAIFTLSGAHCVSLGTETPATEVVEAALSHRVQIVALSMSVSFPARRIAPYLDQVRAGLPELIEVWAGGAGVDRLTRKPKGITTFAKLDVAATALHDFTPPI
jgi:DNA-binding transcriptional MerR regulator/methylmalonyl-CoA mutase cobalamin-binding subunit